MLLVLPSTKIDLNEVIFIVTLLSMSDDPFGYLIQNTRKKLSIYYAEDFRRNCDEFQSIM